MCPPARNDAAYCAAGDFIAYDVNWAVGAFRQVGDAFIFYLLGHEYAHATLDRGDIDELRQGPAGGEGRPEPAVVRAERARHGRAAH